MTWRDLTAAQRRWLLSGAAGQWPEGPIEVQEPQSHAAPRHLDQHSGQEPFHTGGMGYGELVEETFCVYEDGVETKYRRISRQTASGLQVIEVTRILR